MKKVILTCPFTGVDFEALENADGSLVVKHPITGAMNRVNWNPSIERYNIGRQLFKHLDTVSLSEAMEILDVSRQRVSQIAHNGVIPAHEVNGSLVFLRSDVLHYKETRKVGAPRKDA